MNHLTTYIQKNAGLFSALRSFLPGASKTSQPAIGEDIKSYKARVARMGYDIRVLEDGQPYLFYDPDPDPVNPYSGIRMGPVDTTRLSY